MATIGFIGLGIMGAPMAEHLQAAGHKIIALKRKKPLPKTLAKGGAVALATPKQIAAKSEIIITMVPDTPQVEEVLFGKNGVASANLKGKLVIDMSSIAPLATKGFAKLIKKAGAGWVDAPVSGGEVGAKNAALTIMCGGTAGDFKRAKPLFELMGKNITLVGSAGDGQTCKVANQIIVALNIEACAEALLFASKAGADPAKVREALMGGFANSKILEVHAERMIKRTFKPGFRIELHQKDLNLALSGAKDMGMALPNTATAQELFNTCKANGGAAWDHSAMVKALELMAKHNVK